MTSSGREVAVRYWRRTACSVKESKKRVWIWRPGTSTLMRAAVAAAADRVKRSVFGIASLVFLRIVSSCLDSRVDRPRRGDQEGAVLEVFLVVF